MTEPVWECWGSVELVASQHVASEDTLRDLTRVHWVAAMQPIMYHTVWCWAQVVCTDVVEGIAG